MHQKDDDRTGTKRRAAPVSLKKGDADEAALLLMDDVSLVGSGDAAAAAVTNNNVKVGTNVMAGLTVAGFAASLLTGIFYLFHVETFLTAYQLPADIYSAGNLVYGVINAANDVAGAWLVDHLATSRQRSDLVGLTGCLFAVAFLAPFFRPWKQRTLGHKACWFWDGGHFVLSMSLYDTLFSWTMILYGSIVHDDHEMTQSTRVKLLTVFKVVNLAASFVVTRVGLRLFSTFDLYPFQMFLLVLAGLACVLSVIAQGLILGDKTYAIQNIIPKKIQKFKGDEQSSGGGGSVQPNKKRNLEWRSVVRDFWSHKNFRAWIGTNMLLESSNNFNNYFRKTFFDHLVVANGVNKETSDWIISCLGPIQTLLSLAVFIPIRKHGYVKVYKVMFIFNACCALFMALVADSESQGWILTYLCIYPTISSAVYTAVFNLAMADMVMEMKHLHTSSGRADEASFAGLFMGANALICKPMDGLLPIIGSQALAPAGLTAQQNLYSVLIIPPLIYSCLEYWSWNNFTLEPERATQLRTELKTMLSDVSSTKEGGGTAAAAAGGGGAVVESV